MRPAAPSRRRSIDTAIPPMFCDLHVEHHHVGLYSVTATVRTSWPRVDLERPAGPGASAGRLHQVADPLGVGGDEDRAHGRSPLARPVLGQRPWECARWTRSVDEMGGRRHGARRSRTRRDRARARARRRRCRSGALRARASSRCSRIGELLEVGEVRVLGGEPSRAPSSGAPSSGAASACSSAARSAQHVGSAPS